MRKLIVVALVAMLQGCVMFSYTESGMISGPPTQGYAEPIVAAPCCRVTVYRPLPAVDYLSNEYFYYGPTVSILLPSMIYGNGWAGPGIYHIRPQRRYNDFGQEREWRYNGHK